MDVPSTADTADPTPDSTSIPADIAPTRTDPRIVLASAIGSLVEYYDFSAYGYLATITATVFFSGDDPTSALLATLATFAVAFVLRPAGGMIFGHFGDRIGRKKALAATVIMMAVASFAIGVLPTYAAIGTGATAMLVLARCAQGIAAGGEMAGAGSYLVEAAPDHRRGLLTSFALLGSHAGALLASLTVALLTHTLTTGQMHSWGWRVPFLLALPLGLVGIYIRTKLEDTDQFNRIADRGEVAKSPIREVVQSYPLPLLTAVGLSTATFSGYYISFVYIPIHLQKTIGLSADNAFWSTVATLLVACAVIPLFGLLADIVGRKPVLAAGSIGYLTLSYPLFMLLDAGGAFPYVSQILLGVLEAALAAVAFTAFAEMFSARVRYSGTALGYNLAGMAVGGTAPYIALWLIERTGNPLSPAFFLMATAALTLAAVFSLKETRGCALPA
jgi:MHS family proline/betaine transporter-like MFS transporter